MQTPRFDKERFARLLIRARGNRSINQYAMRSGVTSAHISRLSRGLLDTPPTPQTIRKLADCAHNGVTYEQLMEAAGYIEAAGHIAGHDAANSVRDGEAPLSRTQWISIPVVASVKVKRDVKGNRNKKGNGIRDAEGNPNEKANRDVSAARDRLVLSKPEGEIWMNEEEVQEGEHLFLRVTGDWMSGEGILPGDLALIHLLPDPSHVDSGELALVAVDDGEATLRRVYRKNGVVALQAANPAYALQMFAGDEADRVKIIGRVKEIRRQFERKGEHKRLAE